MCKWCTIYPVTNPGLILKLDLCNECLADIMASDQR